MSGLCAAKYAKASGYNVTIYEQTDAIGGTWNYTEKVGKDGFGLDIHTSMYHELRYVFLGYKRACVLNL